MTTETIPLPRDRIESEQDFTARVSDLYAWPDQELRVHFEYNPLRDRWTWACENPELGRLWPKSTAVLGKRYRYGPYIAMQFLDTANKHSHITPRNLGDDIVLGVYPGPLGGSFHPEAGYSEAEEAELLDRARWGRAAGAR